MFAGNFAPQGWAFCDGQLLSISGNDALFALLGTIYGGDGRTTFGLPDLRGRIPIHMGSGPGLTPRIIGQKFGAETHTLTVNELPSHTHTMQANAQNADEHNPGGELLAATAGDLYIADTPNVPMNAASIANAGGSQSHDNMQPFLCVNFIISLFGIFPSRS